MLNIAAIVAMTGQGGRGQGGSEFLVMMVLIIAVMYFLIFRPQAKKQKQQRVMLEQLKKGDKIITAGGIYGTIAAVQEHTIIVKIADNVKVKLSRSSVIKKIEGE